MCTTPQEKAELSNEEALKNFLLDIDCLSKLTPWTNKCNLFDVLKISRKEIRHSNMLAWLLDPNENHNLKDSFLKGLLEAIVPRASLSDLSIFNMLLMNCFDFKVLREWKNIDLLLVSDTNKVVIYIENKVFTSEHDNQLERYKDTIESHYADYTKFFLYLTPQGDAASDARTWLSISYAEILKLLEKAMEKSTFSPEVSFLINNYIDTVRCHIVGDENLIRICNEIYKTHKKALDLIFENKSDNVQEVSNFIVQYLSDTDADSAFHVNAQKCSKSYTRFTSDIMSSVLPHQPIASSGWNTSNYYFYEIVNRGNSIKLQLSLNNGNFSEDESNTYYNRIFQACNLSIPRGKQLWTWKIAKSWNIYKGTEDET